MDSKNLKKASRKDESETAEEKRSEILASICCLKQKLKHLGETSRCVAKEGAGARLGADIMMKGDAGMNRKGKDRGSRYSTRNRCHIVTNNSSIIKFVFLSLYNVFDVLTIALSDCARLREGNPLGRNLTPHPDRMKIGPTDQLAQLAHTTR